VNTNTICPLISKLWDLLSGTFVEKSLHILFNKLNDGIQVVVINSENFLTFNSKYWLLNIQLSKWKMIQIKWNETMLKMLTSYKLRSSHSLFTYVTIFIYPTCSSWDFVLQRATDGLHYPQYRYKRSKCYMIYF